MTDEARTTIAEIIDADSLERWLRLVAKINGQDIANRATLRVLPIAWNWLISTSGADMTLPVLTLAQYMTNPPKNISRKLPEPVQKALFYNADYGTRASATGHRSMSLILGAVNSATTATCLPLPRAPRSVATAVSSAASAYGYHLAQTGEAGEMAGIRTAFWDEIQRDCTLICDGLDLANAPLWHLQSDPFSSEWRAVEAALAGQPDWADSVQWYQGFLPTKAG